MVPKRAKASTWYITGRDGTVATLERFRNSYGGTVGYVLTYPRRDGSPCRWSLAVAEDAFMARRAADGSFWAPLNPAGQPAYVRRLARWRAGPHGHEC